MSREKRSVRFSGLVPLLLAVAACGAGRPAVASPQCSPGNGGITLPDGFCAAVFADQVGVARHLVVGTNGIVYVNLEPARRTSAGTSRIRGEKGAGGIVILRDTTGDGRADLERRIPTDGGTGIALRDGFLYFSTTTTVQRYRLTLDGLGVVGRPDTIVQGIPDEGHISRTIAFDDAGGMFVHVGSDSNVCRISPDDKRGQDPCPELATRAGIWRYDATRLHQRHPTDGEHFATGIRNGIALRWNGELRGLYAASHGRDGFLQLWPQLFNARESAEQPSEEFMRVERGQDYGWPYCYHDPETNQKLLAPEYGGDRTRTGRCAGKAQPLIGFPGHMAPDDLAFYTGSMFPVTYRGGALIAFHGSWNRAPQPQGGYFVAFVPFAGGRPTGGYEMFANGFAGRRLDPGGAAHRPTGLAVGPDGALYVSDDQAGRIWRIIYVGHAP